MDPSSIAESLVARTGHWGRTRRYAVATVLVAIVTVVRFTFDTSLHDDTYFLFVTAVALCALFIDWGPAVWASILSAAIVEYAFLEPRFTVALEPQHVVPLTLFMIGCMLIVIAGQSMRLLVRKLHRAQAEKDALYREMRHRTANNLHLIGATIALEASRTESTDTREILKGIAARIAAIGQVDQLLSSHGIGDTVDAGTHLRELCGFITTSLVGQRPITVSCESEAINMPRDVAETIGIAINELVTNALKHAFVDGVPGHIRVWLATDADDLVLTVEDDGRGCERAAEGGIGWRLVKSLIGRHGGTMATENAKPGCRIRIHLPRGQTQTPSMVPPPVMAAAPPRPPKATSPAS